MSSMILSVTGDGGIKVSRAKGCCCADAKHQPATKYRRTAPQKRTKGESTPRGGGYCRAPRNLPTSICVGVSIVRQREDIFGKSRPQRQDRLRAQDAPLKKFAWRRRSRNLP